MVGAYGPFGYITMGGMFTLLKVREHLANYDDPGLVSVPARHSCGCGAGRRSAAGFGITEKTHPISLELCRLQPP